ncbi:uncharacterized protein [Primulina huaijiensis]|uniref:uncharacterized protein n=1 Tax=Primulina huaijiensis TaxID=1492673 RepID=UPI003CC6DFE4
MGTVQMTWQPNLLKSEKRKHGGPPLGLRNLGNSCYLNSVLQCLTYTPPLANFCLRFLHSSICDLVAAKEKKGECPFCILEKRITRSLSSDAASDAPLKINSCLRIYAEHFRPGRQEDAHEFLRYVIDACHNTCLRLKKLQQQQKTRNDANGVNTGGGGETVVKEIFGGAFQSQVKCLSCGAESNKVDEIMDLSLDILHSGSLKDALQKFFQPEILDGSNKYKCDICMELVTARKQMSILEAPNVFVVQLKRFEGMYGGKVDKPIAFEEMLVLSSYMSKASQDQHPEYDLFATIVHSGCSSDSGHYYAYIKDAFGHWYCCNDSYVSLSTLQEVLSEKVYILFFSRRKPRPRAKVGLIANGLRSHESNGHTASTLKKTNCVQKTVFMKQTSNQQAKTTNSTYFLESNGNKSFSVQKIGCSEKPVSVNDISAHHDNSTNSTNSLESSGIETATIQKPGVVQRPMSEKVSHHQSKTNISTTSLGFNSSKSSAIQKSGLLMEHGNGKQSSDHHAQTSNSTKSKFDQGNSCSQRKLSINGSTNRLLSAGNIKISIFKKDLKEDSGNTAVSFVSVGKQKNESGLSKNSEGIEDTTSEKSLKICNGKNEPVVVGPLEGGFCENNDINTPIASSKREDRQDFQRGSFMGSTNKSGMKRKMKINQPCILLASDDQSRVAVEAFKELLRKEASLILRSCGWSHELYSFMRASKKLCQADGNSASSDYDNKRLLISHAKRNFISKVPESLKETLIERLRLISQEKQSSGI